MDNKIYFVCSKYTVLLETVWWGSCCITLWTLTQLHKRSLESGAPYLLCCMATHSATMQHMLVCWSCSMLSFINWTFVDILQLLSGCMHPMLSITGSTVCQFYVSFTSVCVCMCSCLFFYEVSYTWFGLHKQFCNFCFMLERLINLKKKQLQNKQFKQGLQEGHVFAYPLFTRSDDKWIYSKIWQCYKDFWCLWKSRACSVSALKIF